MSILSAMVICREPGPRAWNWNPLTGSRTSYQSGFSPCISCLGNRTRWDQESSSGSSSQTCIAPRPSAEWTYTQNLSPVASSGTMQAPT